MLAPVDDSDDDGGRCARTGVHANARCAWRGVHADARCCTAAAAWPASHSIMDIAAGSWEASARGSSSCRHDGGRQRVGGCSVTGRQGRQGIALPLEHRRQCGEVPCFRAGRWGRQHSCGLQLLTPSMQEHISQSQHDTGGMATQAGMPLTAVCQVEVCQVPR